MQPFSTHMRICAIARPREREPTSRENKTVPRDTNRDTNAPRRGASAPTVVAAFASTAREGRRAYTCQLRRSLPAQSRQLQVWTTLARSWLVCSSRTRPRLPARWTTSGSARRQSGPLGLLFRDQRKSAAAVAFGHICKEADCRSGLSPLEEKGESVFVCKSQETTWVL